MAQSLSSAFGVVSENALTILWIGNFRTSGHRWNKPRPGELLCMIKTTEVLHLQGYQELKWDTLWLQKRFEGMNVYWENGLLEKRVKSHSLKEDPPWENLDRLIWYSSRVHKLVLLWARSKCLALHVMQSLGLCGMHSVLLLWYDRAIDIEWGRCVPVFQDRYLQTVMFSSVISAIHSQVCATFGCSLISLSTPNPKQTGTCLLQQLLVRLLSIGGMMDKVWYKPKWRKTEMRQQSLEARRGQEFSGHQSRGGGKARVFTGPLRGLACLRELEGLETYPRSQCLDSTRERKVYYFSKFIA